MDAESARRCYNAVTQTMLGVDCNGEEVSNPTQFGILALGQRAPLFLNYGKVNQLDRDRVVAFLREFAVSISELPVIK